ncbi:MAG: hypothetical protein ABSB79_09585 [Syntrophales bacterium]|jgi:hypothetical protein
MQAMRRVALLSLVVIAGIAFIGTAVAADKIFQVTVPGCGT